MGYERVWCVAMELWTTNRPLEAAPKDVKAWG